MCPKVQQVRTMLFVIVLCLAGSRSELPSTQVVELSQDAGRGFQPRSAVTYIYAKMSFIVEVFFKVKCLLLL